MGRHTREELQQYQSLPLSVKIRMTEERIRGWVNEYGLDGVYVSFSGGKDSTVLLDIARRLFTDMQAVFVDTGLEYPEIRQFVKTYDNVVWLRPKMTFKQVIEKYGYPLISKEVSECVDGAKRYLKILTDRQTDRQTDSRTHNSIVSYADKASILNPTLGGRTASIGNSVELRNIARKQGNARFKMLMGVYPSQAERLAMESESFDGDYP